MKKLDEQAIEKIVRQRLDIYNDWAEEGISESDFEWWAEMKKLAVDWLDAPSDRILDLEIDAGHRVLKRMVEYCTPREDDDG